MKDYEKIKDLAESIPSGSPFFYYPEDIRQEFLAILSRGKWWDWLPGWAFCVGDFANEVAVIANGCGWNKVELANYLIMSSCLPHEENPIYSWVGGDFMSHKVTFWECAYATRCWVFYYLRPELEVFISRELDGHKN